jgi:hypothetical protein
MHMSSHWLSAALVVLSLGAARAQESAEEAAPAGPHAHSLSLVGRLGLRGSQVEAEGRLPEAGTSVSRMRAEVDYRWGGMLRAVLEVELREGLELRDAFVRLGNKSLGVRVGHIKPPISAIQLESSWRLPLTRRGILHSVLIGHMRFAGRRPGVQLEWRPAAGRWKPRLVAGAFQGSDAQGRLFQSLGVLETNLMARASVHPGGLEVGLFGALIGTEPFTGVGIGRYWMVGTDVKARGRLGPLRLRAWGEAFYGLSFYGAQAFGRDTPFAAGRLLGAARLGGRRADAPYVELFALGEQTRFDLADADSTLSGRGVGINTGWWERFRLTLQAEQRLSGRSSPYISRGGNQLRSRTVFMLQMETRLEQGWGF